MENKETKTYYLQIQGNKVIGLSVEKQSDNDFIVEATETEFDELNNNLDFMFINGDQVFLDEVLKEKTLNKIAKKQKILELIQELSKDDYKIIKCYEAQLSNNPMPYNIDRLIKQREAIRNQISTLEKEMA
jgi:Txe/YoeB family toxin of Txe-Axe toxin-antitoxin module